MPSNRPMSESTLTAERLREVLDYDSLTGRFTWKLATSSNIKVGTIAGSVRHKGYIDIRVDGVLYRAHRLAWLYVYGVWPLLGLDHKDLCTSNNTISNLREATKVQNMRNTGLSKANTSGVKGVHWCNTSKKWVGRVKVLGKMKYAGYFDTIEEAASSRAKLVQQLHGEFARA